MWDKLSMYDRAKLIKLGVDSGITDLDTIKKTYNTFAEGGDIDSDLRQYTKEGIERAKSTIDHPIYRQRVKNELGYNDTEVNNFIQSQINNMNSTEYSSRASNVLPEGAGISVKTPMDPNIFSEEDRRIFSTPEFMASDDNIFTNHIFYGDGIRDMVKNPDITEEEKDYIRSIASHEGFHSGEKSPMSNFNPYVDIEGIVTNHNSQFPVTINTEYEDYLNDGNKEYLTTPGELRARGFSVMEEMERTGKSFDEIYNDAENNPNPNIQQIRFYNKDDFNNYFNHFVYNPFENPYLWDNA